MTRQYYGKFNYEDVASNPQALLAYVLDGAMNRLAEPQCYVWTKNSLQTRIMNIFLRRTNDLSSETKRLMRRYCNSSTPADINDVVQIALRIQLVDHLWYDKVATQMLVRYLKDVGHSNAAYYREAYDKMQSCITRQQAVPPFAAYAMASPYVP